MTKEIMNFPPMSPKDRVADLSSVEPSLGQEELYVAQRIQEIKATLTKDMESPYQEAVKAEHEVSPHPIISLGNTPVREFRPEHQRMIQTLFKEIEAIRPSTQNASNLIKTVEEIREIILSKIEILKKYPEAIIDKPYLDFLETLLRETVLVLQKLHSLENNPLRFPFERQNAYEEYKLGCELATLFDCDFETLVKDPEKIEQLIKTVYPFLKENTKSRKYLIKMILKSTGLVGFTLYTTTNLVGPLLHSLFVDTSLLGPIPTIPIGLGALGLIISSTLIFIGLKQFNLERKIDMVRKVKELREEIWSKWFPQNPKPQIEQIIKE